MTPKQQALHKKALGAEHALLLFDQEGKLRPASDFNARTLWRRVSECKFFQQPQAMPWKSGVAVTNDAAILNYLSALGKPLPVFSEAGDRPKCFLNPSKLRVGVVNAGGPAAGLNVVNDSITKRHFQVDRDNQTMLGHEYKQPGVEVFGYRSGFRGLSISSRSASTDKVCLIPTHRLNDWAQGLEEGSPLVTDDRALHPVTYLNSSRFKLMDNMASVITGIRKDRLDVLYLVGGNGTQMAAQELKSALLTGKRKHQGSGGHELVVIGGAKTMDNDLLFADTTFGFTTTVDYLVDAILVFHNTVECVERVGMMQVFGAASGFVALYAAYCSGAVDYVVLPEIVQKVGIWALFGNSESERVIGDAMFRGIEQALADTGTSITREDVCAAGILVVLKHVQTELLKRYFDDKKRHALIVVAEGAKGVFGHGSQGKEVMSFEEMTCRVQSVFEGESVKQRSANTVDKVKVSPLEPQYLIRDNPPRSYDIALCKLIGKAMADAALSGFTDCLVSRWCGRNVLVPMDMATRLTHVIDPRNYFYRTMAARYATELNKDYTRATWKLVRKEEEEWLKAKKLDKLISWPV